MDVLCSSSILNFLQAKKKKFSNCRVPFKLCTEDRLNVLKSSQLCLLGMVKVKVSLFNVGSSVSS